MNIKTSIYVALIIATGPTGCGKVPQEPGKAAGTTFHMLSSDESRSRTSVHVRTDGERILDLVLRDVLTNPDFWPKEALADFGMRGKRIGLSSKPGTAWPAEYTPIVDGYQFEYLDPDREKSLTETPELGIDLEHFVFPPPLEKQAGDLYDGRPIVVVLFNIGGRRGAGWVADNGTNIYYDLHRKDGEWVVEYAGCDAQ